MTAQVVAFPVEERNHAIAQEWLYLQMRQLNQGESFARYWSAELAGTIRKLPEDMDKMRRDIGAAKGRVR